MFTIEKIRNLGLERQVAADITVLAAIAKGCMSCLPAQFLALQNAERSLIAQLQRMLERRSEKCRSVRRQNMAGAGAQWYCASVQSASFDVVG